MIASVFEIINGSCVDGPGLRTTIFFKGCNMRCKWCHNPESWVMRDGNYTPEDILKKVLRFKPYFRRNNGGVTFSGGEPLLQINACIEIAKHCKLYGLNVLCYTGFTYEQAIQIKGFNELVEYLDFLIDGRYEKNLRDLSLRFRGSRNQRIIDIQKTKKEGKIVTIE